MANNLTVTYKGNTIHTASATGSATLKTGGTWCEGDIGLSYTFEAGSSMKIIVTTASGATVTASKDGVTYSGTETSSGEYEITVPGYGTYTVVVSKDGLTSTEYVTISETSITMMLGDPVLNNNSWDVISQCSSMGFASSLWSVGDTKAVLLSGTCGTVNLNTTYYCYIIGFDHYSSVEGTGISFGTWKTAATGGKDICLTDNYYDTAKTDGTKIFSMNHWGASNYGGWGASDLRYDILGSVDSAPPQYGSQHTTNSQYGQKNASQTTATNPVANTLMSCLPFTLRSVMKPIKKYFDHYGGSTGQNHMGAVIDYLPLMSEYEIFGAVTYASSYEPSYTMQYSYYSAGNSKIKYRDSSLNAAVYWWERSPYKSNSTHFCLVGLNNDHEYGHSTYSRGIAPVFLV